MITKGREVGERIRVRISTPFVDAGTRGTILRVYRSVADAYDIRFDRDTHHWVMQGCDLERPDAPPRPRLTPGPLACTPRSSARR